MADVVLCFRSPSGEWEEERAFIEDRLCLTQFIEHARCEDQARVHFRIAERVALFYLLSGKFVRPSDGMTSLEWVHEF